jgi:glutaredoxin
MNNTDMKATLFRMVMPKHVCPYGLKAKHLLQRQGYSVEDKWLTSHEQVDAFKEEHGVKTTPQIFIHGKRIGGYEDLRRYFGKKVQDPKEKNYRPVIVLFILTALMALAASFSISGTVFITKTLIWFISFSMVVLALLKLQNVEKFSIMFLNYDLLARQWVPYSYIYPFAEAFAGVLMIAGVFRWISVPIAFFIGCIGAISVVKAVYIDKRDLKCACVGGDSNVPLGLISLIENIMMMAMAIIMFVMDT